MTHGMSGGLARPDALWARAAAVYRERWKVVLAVILLGNAAILAAFLAACASFMGAFFFARGMADVVGLTAMMSAAAFAAAVLVWSQAALLWAAAEPGGLQVCLEAAWRKLPGFLLTCCLYLAACIGGFFLLVLPGLLASFWLAFAPLIYLTEDVGPLDALLKSVHYVRGRSVAVAGLLCLASAAGGLPGFVPVAGAVLQMLAWPFVLMNVAALLAELRRLRGGEPFAPAPRLKLMLFCCMAGCLIPIGLAPWALPWLWRYAAGHAGLVMQWLLRGR
ncbi:MAG: hypothetical protein NTY77_09390 [Elusimicrobia bacterium]|nr:hypothetical protein [Elusimicrobiota bacterium]